MKIVNILFNYKKSKHDNQVLGVERCFIDYSKYLIAMGNEVVAVAKSNMIYCDEVRKTGAAVLELPAFNQSDIFSILRLAFLFFRFRADAIICHSGRALSARSCCALYCTKKNANHCH